MQNSRKTLLSGCLGIAMVGCLGALHAENVIWGGGATSAWASPSSWQQKAVPGKKDLAVVRSKRTAVINTTVPNTRFVIEEGTLRIDHEGALTTSGPSNVGRDDYVGESGIPSVGFLEVTGGSLIMENGSSRLLVGTRKKPINNDISGSVEISGGKFTGGFQIGEDSEDTTGTGKLTIVGTGAAISSEGTGALLLVRNSGTVEFQLDATSVSTLNYKDGTVSFSERAHMVVDGTKYAGGPAELKLIDAAALTLGFDWTSWVTSNLTIQGFNPALTVQATVTSEQDLILTISKKAP